MITIRPAIPTESRDLVEIEKSASDAFLDLPDFAWLAEGDVMPEARQRQLIEGGGVWVAVDGAGALVGFLSAESFGRRLHIWELSVLKELQGQGIGRALIEHAAHSARSNGLSTLTLTTFREIPWNEPFYRRLGFRTLDPTNISDDLRRILDDEVRHGLPQEKRCVMVLALN